MSDLSSHSVLLVHIQILPVQHKAAIVRGDGLELLVEEVLLHLHPSSNACDACQLQMKHTFLMRYINVLFYIWHEDY